MIRRSLSGHHRRKDPMAKHGFKVFDSDMHIMEPPDLWERYLGRGFTSAAPPGRTSDNVRDLGLIFPGGEGNVNRTAATPHRCHNFEKNQRIYRDHSERGWTGEVQLEAMDVEGIDIAVLFPTRGLSLLTHPDRDPRFAAALARAYNDWLHDFCQADPNRLLGGGILQRHPKLKVAFLEANCSWLPWLLWRLDEGYEREGDIFMTDLTMAPSEYFKRQCFISIEPDETPARHTIEEFGCDQLVFSTDYPHGDSRSPHAVESFLKLSLSDADEHKILWANCARFYGTTG